MNEREFHTTLDSDEFLGINHIMGTELNDLPVDLSVCRRPRGTAFPPRRRISPAPLAVVWAACLPRLQVEFMPCGQVAGAIRSIEPAHKIVNDMLLGAAAQLERVRRARL